MGSCFRKPKKFDVKREPSKKVDMENMRALFKQFDTNSDGFIQKDELRNVMIQMGQAPTDAEVDEMFEAADSNKDGNIDFNEFLVIARSNPIPAVSLRDMFYEIDVDLDGFITREELQRAFQRMGHFLTDDDAKVVFDVIDANKDGKIDFGEFSRVMSDKDIFRK
uniref:Calmodulin n=1 Tax=Steinernema glaseri TaxID=37863 RepID=A0A1I7YZ24_9BILA